MGIGMEASIVNQLKKGQGETNRQLDAVVYELRRMNELLTRLASTVAVNR